MHCCWPHPIFLRWLLSVKTSSLQFFFLILRMNSWSRPTKFKCFEDNSNNYRSCPLSSLVAQVVKNLPAMQETWVPSLGQEDSLEEGMATHSSLTWRISWTEEPGRVQSMGSQKVRHSWATNTYCWESIWTFSKLLLAMVVIMRKTEKERKKKSCFRKSVGSGKSSFLIQYSGPPGRYSKFIGYLWAKCLLYFSCLPFVRKPISQHFSAFFPSWWRSLLIPEVPPFRYEKRN